MVIGIVYKLQSTESNDCYIGSTTRTLFTRISIHKTGYKRWCNNKELPKCSSFEIFAKGNYEIIRLETIEFKNSEDHKAILSQKEKEWYYKNKENAVNANVPGRTLKEYYIDNKVKILDRCHERYSEDKDFRKRRISESLSRYYNKVRNYNILTEFKRLGRIRV